MKVYQKLVVLLFIPIMAFGLHKYYISLTKIDFVREKKSVQITMKFFLDDIEYALENRYEQPMELATQYENKQAGQFLERYVRQKFRIWINDQEYSYNYLGKEYENNEIFFYLEIEGIEDISSVAVQNSMLFEEFSDQKNYVKINAGDMAKTLILVKANDKEMLKL